MLTSSLARLLHSDPSLLYLLFQGKPEGKGFPCNPILIVKNFNQKVILLSFSMLPSHFNRLDEKDAYDLIWEDYKVLSGKVRKDFSCFSLTHFRYK